MGENKKEWKIYQVSENHWQKMILYYKWSFSALFIASAGVLTYEKMYLFAACFIVFAWYVFPLRIVQVFNGDKGAIAKKVILCSAIAILIIAIIVGMMRIS